MAYPTQKYIDEFEMAQVKANINVYRLGVYYKSIYVESRCKFPFLDSTPFLEMTKYKRQFDEKLEANPNYVPKEHQ